METKNLELLGLSKDEAIVYSCLCEYGLLTMTGIAKHTKLHRPRLYTLLPQLLGKEIIEERTVGKRTLYKSVEPRLLYNLLKERQDAISDTIESLQVQYEGQAQKPDIGFYLGQSGYKTLFDDIADVVPKGGQIFRYSARHPGDDTFEPSPAYVKRRNTGHFERLAITSEAKAKLKKRKRLDRFVKVVPKSFDLFEDHVSQMIYEDRIVFTDHEHETTFIIKSEKIASMQKKLFKLLWKHLKSVDA